MPSFKGGYWGRIGWVDLTTGKIWTQEFDESFAKKWLGGVGLAAKLIYDWVQPHFDPLGPRNLLVVATGPFQAGSIASAAKAEVCARSPLTGYWGESNGGGHSGARLKRAGFDALAITGKAEKPVYIYVEEGKIEIRDATSYWGMDTVEATDAIAKDLAEKKRLSILTIGQAGENLVKYACILADKHGAFGRTGMGAVMGSKNLKAMVFNATMSPPVAEPDKLKEVYGEILKKINESPFTKLNREHGQAAAVVPREENGLLPMKNWMQDRWPDGAEKIGTPRFTEELKIKPWACEFCVMGCHRRITNPDYFPADTGGPEYETLAMIGSNLLVDDLKAVVQANELCNRLGIDTIEVGAVLAWAFESYERGVISADDTGGIKLEWGSGEALVRMIEKIGKREDIGDVLAEGLRGAVDKYPKTAPWAVEVMGAGVAAHDPRAFFGQTVTTIASTRGSCHLHGFAEALELGFGLPELGPPVDKPVDRFEWLNKGKIGAIYQDIQQIWNSYVWCFFYFFCGVDLSDQIALLNALTGWDMKPQDLRKIGERIVNTQHAFNLKMGLVPEKEFRMPERLATPHREGGAANRVPPWQYILRDYYEERKWINGIPTVEKLKELELNDVAEDLMERGIIV